MHGPKWSELQLSAWVLVVVAALIVGMVLKRIVFEIGWLEG